MSGIYIHIPFCKQACHYCNFHFSTSLKYKDEMIAAIIKEIALQKDYLNAAPVETVYFGGGTPSLLSSDEILRIFDTLHRFHAISSNAEITLEANPDDLTDAKIKAFRQTPINRFSIGVQSFHEADLQLMNRAHTENEALRCIQNVQAAGFDNLTIDLIYGTPTLTDDLWRANLATAFELAIPHISCYALTVEPNTALAHFIKKGKTPPVDEEQSARQSLMLMTAMAAKGYDHYEISNFAKPNRHAVHNSNYWFGKPYLGLGPSAHSFNGHSRQWNVAHNAQYLTAIQNDKLPFEKEELSTDDCYNEYIMTGFRTMWGVKLERIAGFGAAYEAAFLTGVAPFLKQKLVTERNNSYILTTAGKLKADWIASELFF